MPGAALFITGRRYGSGLVAPLAYFLAGLLFYLALPILGFDLDAARSRGWLLGPFQHDSLLYSPSGALLQNVQWRALPSVIPMILVVVGLCLLGRC